MNRSILLAALSVLSGCIDFEAAERVYCMKNPSACSGSDGGNSADGGNTTDGGNSADGGNSPDGGAGVGLRGVVSGAGRMTGGTLSLQLEMGRATGATRMTGGTFSLTGSAAVQR